MRGLGATSVSLNHTVLGTLGCEKPNRTIAGIPPLLQHMRVVPFADLTAGPFYPDIKKDNIAAERLN